MHSNISPGFYHWIGTRAKPGVLYCYAITNTFGSSEIYFDAGKDSAGLNKQRFDKLYEEKEKIEEVFGGKLEWERLNDKRASRIAVRFKGVGLKDKGRWNELQEKMVDAMVRLEKAFGERIKDLE